MVCLLVNHILQSFLSFYFIPKPRVLQKISNVTMVKNAPRCIWSAMEYVTVLTIAMKCDNVITVIKYLRRRTQSIASHPLQSEPIRLWTATVCLVKSCWFGQKELEGEVDDAPNPEFVLYYCALIF